MLPRIKIRLSVLLVLLVTVINTLMVLSIYVINRPFINNFVSQNIASDSEILALTLLNDLNSQLTSRVETIELLAQLPDIKNSLSSYTLQNSDVVLSELRLIENYYLDKYGSSPILDIGLTDRVGDNLSRQLGQPDNYQDQLWWQAAQQQDIYLLPLYFNGEASSLETRIAVRVEDESANFLGIIHARINISHIIDEIVAATASRIPYWLDQESIMSVRDYKLITSDGRILYATEDLPVFSQFNTEPFKAINPG